MPRKPDLYDLWREFRYFADVRDPRYLSYLEFFLTAKGRVSFGPKGSSSAVPSAAVVSSAPSNPPKLGICKAVALPLSDIKSQADRLRELGLGFLLWRWNFIPDVLVKEFAFGSSQVSLPYRGKPMDWTVEHWRKTLDRRAEEEEGGMVFTSGRLTVPEGVNIDDLFSEPRRTSDKNGYRYCAYRDPLRRVIAESLMCLFSPFRTTYLVLHKVAFIKRLLRGEKVNWGVTFRDHVRNTQKTVTDGFPIYVGSFLVHLHRKNDWLTETEKELFGEDEPYLTGYQSEDEGPDFVEITPTATEVFDPLPSSSAEPSSRKRVLPQKGPLLRKRVLISIPDEVETDEDPTPRMVSRQESVVPTPEVSRPSSPTYRVTSAQSFVINELAPIVGLLEEEGRRLTGADYDLGPGLIGALKELIVSKKYEVAEETHRRSSQALSTMTKTLTEKENERKEAQKQAVELANRVAALEGKLESCKKEKEDLQAEVQQLRKTAKVSHKLKASYAELQSLDFQDSTLQILEDMKNDPGTKEARRANYLQLAHRVRTDYEQMAREYAYEMEEIRTQIFHPSSEDDEGDH
ncbi:hypothetical protein R1sor_012859 [Riccia sorocarpa]|uniref:Aminotransferase-like plant mobile domain-containing protein n=1 Tax=Riccia sorocarpa TaxID=122646 RepID=A0ABD3I5C2_9MARC